MKTRVGTKTVPTLHLVFPSLTSLPISKGKKSYLDPLTPTLSRRERGQVVAYINGSFSEHGNDGFR